MRVIETQDDIRLEILVVHRGQTRARVPIGKVILSWHWIRKGDRDDISETLYEPFALMYRFAVDEEF